MLVARGAEAAIAADAVGKSVDGHESSSRDRHHDELGDPVAYRHVVRLARVRVEQGHLDLAPISGVDSARRVDDGDAVLRGEAAAGDDEGDVPLGERDPYAGADERALSRLETDGLGRDEIRARVPGMGVGRNVGGDNGDVHGFGHSTRVMQKTQNDPRVSPAYRERLSPSLWAIVSAAVVAPMAALMFVPLDKTLALVAGIVVAIAVVTFMISGAPSIEVSGGILRAGRAHIDVRLLGDPEEFTGEDARRARGQDLDPRDWHLIRGGMDGVVRMPVRDPDDPTPHWVLSTRTPDRLAAAIRRAQTTAPRAR